MERFILGLMFLSLGAQAQSPASRYQSVFENDVVAVYRLDLPVNGSVSTLQSAHDSFWLSLGDANVTFSVQRGSSPVQFRSGDTRFFPSFDTKLVSNTGETQFRSVLVVLKPRALISSECECTGNTGKTVCGCKGAGHLEALWALNMGAVTLAGTQLAPDEKFRGAAQRDDMLLVAVTDLDLNDDIENPGPDDVANSAIHLKAGGAAWIRGGRHRFSNIGAEAARFVTFEF
ncbi:MAG TPA: hypothetical protein VG498_24060 [Terriglobales bacterium]|nr:hypothetical protein [Terriglobales bacterium]